jgi:hypothetical protein
VSDRRRLPFSALSAFGSRRRGPPAAVAVGAAASDARPIGRAGPLVSPPHTRAWRAGLSRVARRCWHCRRNEASRANSSSQPASTSILTVSLQLVASLSSCFADHGLSRPLCLSDRSRRRLPRPSARRRLPPTAAFPPPHASRRIPASLPGQLFTRPSTALSSRDYPHASRPPWTLVRPARTRLPLPLCCYPDQTLTARPARSPSRRPASAFFARPIPHRALPATSARSRRPTRPHPPGQHRTRAPSSCDRSLLDARRHPRRLLDDVLL